MLRNNLRSLASAFVALLLVQPIYGEAKFQEYPARKASDCAVKAEKAGLVVGIQPIEDPKEVKAYFDTDLISKGFIPVYVVLENSSSGESLLFDMKKVSYGESASNTSSSDITPNKGEGLGITSLVLGSAVLGLIAAHEYSSGMQVRLNLLAKELQSKTLSPGISAHGFLYIKKGSGKKIYIQIPITRSGTDETFVMELTF